MSSEEHKRRTEAHLVLGGFGIIVAVGGVILWLLYGTVVTLIALGVVLGAVALLGLFVALLRAMEAWAKAK